MICQTTRPSPPFYDTPRRQARLGLNSSWFGLGLPFAQDESLAIFGSFLGVALMLRRSALGGRNRSLRKHGEGRSRSSAQGNQPSAAICSAVACWLTVWPGFST